MELIKSRNQLNKKQKDNRKKKSVKPKSWFFDGIHKIDKPVVTLIRKEREGKGKEGRERESEIANIRKERPLV